MGLNAVDCPGLSRVGVRMFVFAPSGVVVRRKCRAAASCRHVTL